MFTKAIPLLGAILALGAPSDSQGAGSPIGTVELANLTGTRAESFGELHGRLVLIEFFAHW
jgi:hypothetical protein